MKSEIKKSFQPILWIYTEKLQKNASEMSNFSARYVFLKLGYFLYVSTAFAPFAHFQRLHYPTIQR